MWKKGKTENCIYRKQAFFYMPMDPEIRYPMLLKIAWEIKKGNMSSRFWIIGRSWDVIYKALVFCFVVFPHTATLPYTAVNHFLKRSRHSRIHTHWGVFTCAVFPLSSSSLFIYDVKGTKLVWLDFLFCIEVCN